MQAFKKSSRRAVVIAGVAGVAVAGAVGIGAAAYADGGPSTGTPSVSVSGAPQPSAASSGGPVSAGAAPSAGSGAGTGPSTSTTPALGALPKPPKPGPHIGGTVESISGSTVTVKDMDGFTRTIVLGDSVKVTAVGSTSSASIRKGEHIDATGTVDDNGTSLDASAVTVGTPKPPAGGPAAGGPAAGGPGRGAPKPPAATGAAAPAAAPTARPSAPTSGATSVPTDSSTAATGS